MQKKLDVEHIKFSVAVLVCSWAGFSGILFVPLWVTASTHYLDISDAFAGRLAAVQHSAVALSSFGLIKLVRALPSRWLFASGITMIFLANVLPLLTHSILVFIACRFLSGLGEGVSLAVMHSLIAQRDRPDRYFGLMNFGVTIFAIIAYPLVSPLIALHSVVPVFVAAAIVSLIGLPFAMWMGKSETSLQLVQKPPPPPVSQNRDGMLALFALVVFFVGEGALWTYFTSIGLSKNMTFEEVGTTMSLALLCGLLATVVIHFLDVRLGRTIPIVVSLVGLCFVAMMFAYSETKMMFQLAAFLMYFVFLFTVTYSSGLLAHTDSSGAIVAAAPGARSIGNILGPVLASFTVGLGHYVYLGWTAFIFYVLALVLFASVAIKYDRLLAGAGRLVFVKRDNE